jgi:hypothetical protein
MVWTSARTFFWSNDYILATLRLQSTLKRWRDKVEEYAVEGNSWIAMAELHLPEIFGTTEGDIIAMRLARFVCVGQDEIQAAPAKIKEEKRCEAIDEILCASCVGGSVKVNYLQDDDKIDGLAIKQNEGKWMLLLNNNKQFLADPVDLQEPSKFDILQVPQNLSTVQKRYHQQSENGQRAQNEAQVKQELHSKAAKLREKRDLIFLNQCCSNRLIQSLVQRMARLLHQPFSCDIDGRAVQITKSDCAMMLRSSIIEELTNTV